LENYNKTAKTVVVATKLTPEIASILTKLAEAQGLTESEYIRSLLLREMEKLSLLSTRVEKLKQTMK